MTDKLILVIGLPIALLFCWLVYYLKEKHQLNLVEIIIQWVTILMLALTIVLVAGAWVYGFVSLFYGE